MRARTVSLNDVNSDDLDITLINVSLSAAEPRLLTVDVPYSDGLLDMTEIFGAIRYKNRDLTMDFHIPYGFDHWNVYAKVSNQFNGQKTRITFSADPEHYWEGRLVFGKLQVNNDGHWGFSVKCNVYPYKRNIDNTLVYGNASTSGKNITCTNNKMRTTPTFTLDRAAVINFNSKSYSATASGDYTWTDIVFQEGINTVNIKGSGGTVNYCISYKEGSL